MASARAPIVRTRALTKRYGDVVGVENLDLELEDGEIFGFIGPNGAGKTTTIRLLLDLIRPTSGAATVFGLDVRESAVEIHARTGYLPSELTVFDRLTGYEFFDWLGRLRDRHDGPYVDELAERLSLDRSRVIRDLSAGNRRKVGLIQALMHRPDLVILDEPTASLDPLVTRELRLLLSEVREQGGTVFLSSHVLSEVETVCDRVGTIVDGSLRGVMAVDELRALSRRRVQFTVEGAFADGELAGVPGVSDVRVEPGVGGTSRIALDLAGTVDEFVKRLAQHTVLDLTSEPLSLEDLFLEGYENGGGGDSHGGSVDAT